MPHDDVCHVMMPHDELRVLINYLAASFVFISIPAATANEANS